MVSRFLSVTDRVLPTPSLFKMLFPNLFAQINQLKINNFSWFFVWFIIYKIRNCFKGVRHKTKTYISFSSMANALRRGSQTMVANCDKASILLRSTAMSGTAQLNRDNGQLSEMIEGWIWMQFLFFMSLEKKKLNFKGIQQNKFWLTEHSTIFVLSLTNLMLDADATNR